MFSRFIFWPWFTGLFFLVAGLTSARKELSAARGVERAIALGTTLFAASLAVFGAEHIAGAKFVMQAVPPWMPAPLFWTYLVGLALIATAISLIVKIYDRWAATLSGAMILSFVILMHVPRVIANPRDRIAWALVLRDSAFAGGAWALAGTLSARQHWMTLFGRATLTLAVLVFAVEHFLHPEFAPGVPLTKLTPAWMPLGLAWGYLTGLILLAAGLGLVLKQTARPAAVAVGILMAVLTVFFYLPILAAAAQPSDMNEAINYVADTLLFAGAALLVARATPGKPAPAW